MPMMVLVRQPQSRVNGKQRWYGHVLRKEDIYSATTAYFDAVSVEDFV